MKHSTIVEFAALHPLGEVFPTHDSFDISHFYIFYTSTRPYVVIDEYDNFTNTILAESRDNYEALCHGDGFFKQFFNELKLATTGTDAPVTRLIVTSGFNIASNISMNPAFAALTGFTHDDLREMLAYYRANAGFAFDVDAVFETMRRWYDNYRFSPESGADGAEVPCVANPTLVLYYMQYFLQNHKPQPELVDRNLRTDYMKIRHIITEGRKVNFEPQLNRWPQIGHAALVELKYLKTADDASSEALAKIKSEALDQMNRYAADHDLARAWNLKPAGTVQLHRIVLVFHGGDVALAEDVIAHS